MSTDYRALIEEIIQFEKDFVGKDIALRAIEGINGLKFDNEGKMSILTPDQTEIIVKQVVDNYSNLLGSVSISMLSPIFAKYGYQVQRDGQ